MDSQRIFALGATQIAVGLSSIIQIKPDAYEITKSMRYLSGGSLEIVKAPPALTGTSAAGWAGGYLVGTTEQIQLGNSMGGPQNFFLAASGATAVAQFIIGYGTGYSMGL